MQSEFGGNADFIKDFLGGVVGQDRYGGLSDDITSIRLSHHVMQRRAGLGFAVEYRPIDRCPASVLR